MVAGYGKMKVPVQEDVMQRILALLMILDRHYIPSEERRLEKTFGKAYLEYKQRVRKWI